MCIRDRFYNCPVLQLPCGVHFGVVSALFEQLGMGTHLDNGALVHHDNTVCIVNGREPVGDDEAGAVGS